MLQFSANLSFLFNELSFAERFAAAANSGFRGVEFLGIELQDTELQDDESSKNKVSVATLEHVLGDLGLELVLFNSAIGNWDRGDRGIAAVKGRESDAISEVERAIQWARRLNCSRIHVMSGLVNLGANIPTLRSNLRRLAPIAQENRVRLLLEPINQIDMPGYLLSSLDETLELIEEVDSQFIQLQFDIYHRQMSASDAERVLDRYLPHAGHVQIANPPDRGEPNSGDIDYEAIFSKIDISSYTGWIGCEYRPRTTTQAGLKWLRRYAE